MSQDFAENTYADYEKGNLTGDSIHGVFPRFEDLFTNLYVIPYSSLLQPITFEFNNSNLFIFHGFQHPFFILVNY